MAIIGTKKRVLQCMVFYVWVVSQIRKYIEEESVKIVVHAFITSILDSCNSLLYRVPQHLLSRLQSNTAARIVTRTRKFDHMTPILKELHWLAVSHCMVYKIFSLVKKAVNGAVPCYIGDLLNYCAFKGTLRSSFQHLLATSKARLKTCGEKTLPVAASGLWN